MVIGEVFGALISLVALSFLAVGMATSVIDATRAFKGREWWKFAWNLLLLLPEVALLVVMYLLHQSMEKLEKLETVVR